MTYFENYMAAGNALMKMSQGMNSIKQFTPYRGSKESWNSTIGNFVLAAFRGIGACGNNDIDGLKQAFAELRAINSQGHRAHK